MNTKTRSLYIGKTIRHFLAITLLFIGILSLASLHTVFAQGGNTESITMSPTKSEYDVDAGKTVNDKLTIVNSGTTAYDFIVYARPYSVNNNQYDNPNFTDTPESADLYKWVQFPKTTYHLEANTSTELKYSINVPEGAAPGGHYGVIFAETQSKEEAQSGNAVIRKKRVGSLIYATVNGDVKLAGEAAGGDIPFWQVEPPLKAIVSAKNTGNTHFTDTVNLTVRDIFGNLKYQVKKDLQVLPDTTRTIDLAWDNASWFGLYRVETHQKFLDKEAKSEGYVLVMPRFLPIALLVIILIGGVYAFVRRRKK